MDTIKLLLGTIIALLIAALVMSWNNMNQGVKNSPADEYERLRKQNEELRTEHDRILLEKQIAQHNVAMSIPVAPPIPDKSAEELEAVKLQLQLMEAEKNKAERTAEVSDAENLELIRLDLEKKNALARQTRLISQALLVGKVREYVEDAQIGDFVTLEVIMPDQILPETILAIRRNTGILGQLKVTAIEGGEAVASPLPGFGTIHPEPGDELILPPF